jgi:hypothetical protein
MRDRRCGTGDAGLFMASRLPRTGVLGYFQSSPFGKLRAGSAGIDSGLEVFVLTQTLIVRREGSAMNYPFPNRSHSLRLATQDLFDEPDAGQIGS